MPNTSRRERERQQHRHYILETAEQLFAEDGFLKVSMRQIAQKAEFALGTLYRFFEGKEELYDQLLDRKTGEFVSFVSEEMAAGRNPSEKVRKFIEAKLGFFHRNLDFLRLYLAETHGCRHRSGKARSESLREKHEGLLGKLVEVFEQGIAAGVFHTAQPQKLARALDGLTSAFAWSWTDKAPGPFPAEEIDTAERIFLKGAMAQV